MEKEPKFMFYRIDLELTRECNLKCPHCMRGEAQNISMKPEIIERVLSQAGAIGSLLLTGGEPFLHPELVEHTVEFIIANNIKVGQLQAITNGTIPEENMMRCIQAFNRFAEWVVKCDNYTEDKRSCIEISKDIYHGTDADALLEKYSPYAGEYAEITLHDGTDKRIYSEGRAESLNVPKACTECMCLHGFHYDHDIYCPVEITTKGGMIMANTLSWTHIDKYAVGDIMQDSLNSMILYWQKKYQLISCRMSHAWQELLNRLLNFAENPDVQKVTDKLLSGFMEIVDYVRKKAEFLELEEQQRLIKLMLAENTKGVYWECLQLYGEEEPPASFKKEINVLWFKDTKRRFSFWLGLGD